MKIKKMIIEEAGNGWHEDGEVVYSAQQNRLYTVVSTGPIQTNRVNNYVIAKVEDAGDPSDMTDEEFGEIRPLRVYPEERKGKEIKLKQRGVLKDRFRDESWDKISFWPDGSWAEVGTGYGGEQDGNNPVTSLSRSSFYDTTEKQRRMMIKAIEKALNEDAPILSTYEGLGGTY